MVPERHLRQEWFQHRVRTYAASLLGDVFLFYSVGYNHDTRLKKPVNVSAGKAPTKYHHPEPGMCNNGNNSDCHGHRPPGNRTAVNAPFFYSESGGEPRGNLEFSSGMTALERQYDNDDIIRIIRGELEASAGEPAALCTRPAPRAEYVAKITNSIKNTGREL